MTNSKAGETPHDNSMISMDLMLSEDEKDNEIMTPDVKKVIKDIRPK